MALAEITQFWKNCYTNFQDPK